MNPCQDETHDHCVSNLLGFFCVKRGEGGGKLIYSVWLLFGVGVLDGASWVFNG